VHLRPYTLPLWLRLYVGKGTKNGNHNGQRIQETSIRDQVEDARRRLRGDLTERRLSYSLEKNMLTLVFFELADYVHPERVC